MTEVARKPYRLIPLSEAILFKLYIAHVSDDENDSYSIDNIKDMFKEDVSRKLIRSAIDLIGYSIYRDRKLRRHGRSNSWSYSITDEGILSVEADLRRPDSVASFMYASADASLDTIAGLDGIFLTEDERNELDAWSPLPIERDRTEYKETIGALEEAFDTIRADNGFAATHPEQRTGILAALEDGIQTLKSKIPSAEQLQGMILRPLRWISVTFSNTLIGESAKKAAEKLVQYIASLMF
jgi:hypothetical protein